MLVSTATGRTIYAAALNDAASFFEGLLWCKSCYQMMIEVSREKFAYFIEDCCMGVYGYYYRHSHSLEELANGFRMASAYKNEEYLMLPAITE